MKTIIITLLVMSLLWQGCYSYSSIEKIQSTKLSELDNEDIKLTLKNGKTFSSNALMHGVVNRPSHFVFGIGKNLSNDEDFSGRIDYSNIDKINKNKDNSTNYVLKDGSVIQLNYNYNKIVLPEEGKGFWLINKNESGFTTFHFISINDIKDVEILEFDYVKTGGLVLGVGAVIALFVSSIEVKLGGFGSNGRGFPF